MAAVILLGERSQKNSYMRHIIRLYLYSTGASRQQIGVLNHLGLGVSYTTLARRGHKNDNLDNAKARRLAPEQATQPQQREHSSKPMTLTLAVESSPLGVHRQSRLSTLEPLSQLM